MPETVPTTTGFLLKIAAAHLFPICLRSKSGAPSPLVTTSTVFGRTGKQCSLAVCSSCNPVTHWVGRVLSFSSSRRNWDFPNPPPAGECAPRPWFRGEGHTRWRERGWESANSNEGTYSTLWYSAYICTLCYHLTAGWPLHCSMTGQ